ncbi:MAG: IS21-like element helper ATPase IstB [Desulfarculus sp.]|nr:IS21-like element helper ATPase IstB [Pseudomonadota bacterium]MBU4574521.1 IS21-like element helper ATPase IstB [Pseudomonadota bacterium]MBV1737379.1 IS21-like element helper ATPase IstB [Desulfarculus sp.]MBV1751895.1 IS21-like element helper ATPase IstB [Desulfarculus sp.]MCG2763231.1 IS21-like element helper ATPase IstB [Desulfarculaceae bacterium]
MLTNPIMEKLSAMRLNGMAKALAEQMEMSDLGTLSFEERLGLMVDREMSQREDRRLQTRLRKAKLRVPACVEDIDFRHKRGLDKSLIMALAACEWIKGRQNLIITGPTGAGKTYLACALVHKSCLEGHSAVYRRLPNLLREITMARADGSYPKKMAAYAKTNLIALDDWGLDRLTREQALDLLELLEDRHGLKSTLVAAQVPIDHWHEIIGDPTLADAVLDRLIHSAHKINLKGESMRKKYSALTKEEQKS